MGKVIAVIPARFSSNRLPGKPLVDIEGKSLIQRVWEAVSNCKKIDEIYVAVDDQRVQSECESFGAKSIMTNPELNSGTDRIYEAITNASIEADIIVNIQGDEPLLQAETIDNLLDKFIDSSADVGTLIKKIDNHAEVFDPNVVKVVLDNNFNAMYFTRNVIPFVRDIKPIDWIKHTNYYKHIGVYVYKKESLFRFAELPQSNLEKAEKLEQLRLMQDGAKYLCVLTDKDFVGVDTQTDLQLVRDMIKRMN